MSDPAVKMKVKKFIVADDLILQILTTGFHMPKFTIEEGIPAGAQILEVVRDSAHSTAVYILHESFQEIPLSKEVPTFDIVVTIAPPAGAAN